MLLPPVLANRPTALILGTSLHLPCAVSSIPFTTSGMSIHPLAAQSRPRVDLFTKGRQASIIKDSLLLVQQAAKELHDRGNILYINTLTQHAPLEEAAEKISARGKCKVVTFSASGQYFMDRLAMLQHTVHVKNVKLVVLNSFEFAAFESRQRSRIVQWLRELRDGEGVRIVVYSQHDEQRLSALMWLADSVEETAQWRRDTAMKDLIVQQNSIDATLEFVEALDTAVSDNDLQERLNELLIDRDRLILEAIERDHFTKRSLKYNDLRMPVTPSTHSGAGSLTDLNSRVIEMQAVDHINGLAATLQYEQRAQLKEEDLYEMAA